MYSLIIKYFHLKHVIVTKMDQMIARMMEIVFAKKTLAAKNVIVVWKMLMEHFPIVLVNQQSNEFFSSFI